MATISERKVRFNLTDINPSKIKTNAQGGIQVEGAVIKTGVFVYQTADGGSTKEYLPASEIFKQEVMDSMKGAPVTNEHPEQMISPDNFKNNAVGFVQDVRNESNKYLVASLVINDTQTIADIKDGKKRELSAGYFTEPKMLSGVSPSGERYDVVQTQIIFNHCSLVEMGRCGPDVSLRLNSMGNLEMLEPKSEALFKPKLRKKSSMAKKKNVSEERANVIREEDGQYCLYTHDGNRKLGCHASLEEAQAQERAVQASKHNEVTKENLDALLELVASLEEKLGLSYDELVALMVENADALEALLSEGYSEDSPKQTSEVQNAAPATEVQTYIFSKDKFETESKVKSWLDKNDAKFSNIDETSDSFRARLEPGNFAESFRTIDITDGVKAVVGRKNNKETKADVEKNNKAENDKFEQRVQAEVETRMGLLIAAKQLGVQNLNHTIQAPELRLMIVQTTKPHINTEGRSEDYMQALLEDSLSSVDINSFWVAADNAEKNETSTEGNVASASEEETTNIEELEDFDGAPETLEDSATLNSLLATVRSNSRNNDVGGNHVLTDTYSTEDRAQMLVKWQGKKLL